MIITLYANVQLTQDKNFAVDDIEDYLATISSSNILVETSQNYFKQKLNTSILLELTQESLNYTYKRYNYCRIQNGTDQPVYYFITNREWRSQTVVALTLYQDTIATLGLLPLTNKTLIHRQHIDRFYKKSGVIYPLVDKINEGINPVLYKTNEQYIKEVNNLKWYIIYMTENPIDPTAYNQVNSIKQYFAPEKSLNMRKATYLNLSYTDFEVGKYYLLSAYQNSTNYIGVTIDGSNNAVEKGESFAGSTSYYYIFWRAGTQIDYEYHEVKEIDGEETDTIVTSSYVASELKLHDCPYLVGVNISSTKQTSCHYDKNDSFQIGYELVNINGVRSITFDRSDSKLVKVCEVPFCPATTHTAGDGSYYFDENLEVTNTSQGRLLSYGQIDGLKEKLIEDPLSSVFNYSPLVVLSTINSATKSKSALASKNYEPKILFSEFYSPKFIYDSFDYSFNFENLDFESWRRLGYKFIQKTSDNISSSFLFDFTPKFPLKISAENYDNILVVNRNNELALYNNQYLNYLRTGYNYDVKARKQQETMSTIGATLGVVGGIVSAGLGIASMNPAIAVSGIIGGATAITSSIVSAVNQSITASNSMEQKMASLKAQKTSVNTADDLSLLKYYSDNGSPKIAQFVPSEIMQNNIFKLFHYTGYKCEYLGVPNYNTRLRFNFIQAEIDIDFMNASLSNLNAQNEILEDYKARFAVGLTIIHYFESAYDFEQKFENWETILENDLSN